MGLSCGQIKNLISGHIQGEVSQINESGIIRHLEKCPSCKAAYERYSKIISALKEMGTRHRESIENIEIPHGFEDRLKQRLASVPVGPQSYLEKLIKKLNLKDIFAPRKIAWSFGTIVVLIIFGIFMILRTAFSPINTNQLLTGSETPPKSPITSKIVATQTHLPASPSDISTPKPSTGEISSKISDRKIKVAKTQKQIKSSKSPQRKSEPASPEKGKTEAVAQLPGHEPPVYPILGFDTIPDGKKKTSSEYDAGLKMAESVEANYPLLKEEDQQVQRIRKIAEKIVRVTDKRAGLTFSFNVLDTDKVIAMALPGGFVYVSRGLINLCGDSDDELAMILAHEITHESKGHFDDIAVKFKSLDRCAYRLAKGSSADDTTIDIPKEYQKEFRKAMTKDIEINADAYGILYASMAGYRPMAAVDIISKISQWQEDNDIIKDLKHPSYIERESKIKERLLDIFNNVYLFNSGVDFYQQGKYSDAVIYFRKFLSVYPSREVYNNLGLSHHKLALSYFEDDRKSRDKDTIYKKSFHLAPETRAAVILRGTEDNEKKFHENINSALLYYGEAIARDPEYFIAYNNRGCALDEKGQFVNAVLDFDNAIQIYSGYSQAYNNRGVSYSKQNKLSLAIKDFQKAIQLDPNYSDPHFNLGMVYSLESNNLEAGKEFEKYLKLDENPDSTWRKTVLKKLEKNETILKEENKAKTTIGNLKLGTASDKIITILGKPSDTFSALPGGRLEIWSYPEKGLKLTLKNDELVCIEADSKFSGPLPNGVSFGIKADELESKLGKPSQVEKSVREESWIYLDEGISFVFRDKKLSSWQIFTRP